MSTKREGILSAITTLMTGVSGVSNSAIFRSRVTALQRDELPAIVIEPVNDVADDPTVARLQWSMTVLVTIYVSAATPDQSADAIVNDVHNKIMQSAALSALVVDAVPVSTDWRLIDADKPRGEVSMQFRVSYQTSRTDLSSL